MIIYSSAPNKASHFLLTRRAPWNVELKQLRLECGQTQLATSFPRSKPLVYNSIPYLDQKMGEEVSEDATVGALENEDVLMEIFKYLPTSSLLTCSCVNQLWSREARSFIRDYRECTVKLDHDVDLWQRFSQLDKVLGDMKVIPFNSLRISVTWRSLECDEKSEVRALTNLMITFNLKFLSVFEHGGWGSYSGPAASTLLELIRRNSSVLQELEIRSDEDRNASLFKDWEPLERFEKLKKLSISKDSSVAAKCGKKIILGAPNLRSIHNDCLHMILNNVIPPSMYATLERLAFALEDIELVEKIADKLDHLEELIVKQERGWLKSNLSRDKDANRRRFIRIFQKVLALNAMTLCNLDIRCQDNSLLSELKLPTLAFVKNLNLTVIFISKSLAHMMWTNFPGSFPNLRQVRILEKIPPVLDYYYYNRNMVHAQDVIDAPNASKTTLELSIDQIIRTPDFVTLRSLFPNVIKLSIKYEDLQPLGLIANLWPSLTSLSVRTGPLGKDSDVKRLSAQVLGLHPRELEVLGHEDRAFLELVQVPPRRPCVGTLKVLEHFKLEYSRLEDPGRVKDFHKLVDFLLVGRRPGLNFILEHETSSSRSIPRFGDLWDDRRYF